MTAPLAQRIDASRNNSRACVQQPASQGLQLCAERLLLRSCHQRHIPVHPLPPRLPPLTILLDLLPRTHLALPAHHPLSRCLIHVTPPPSTVGLAGRAGRPATQRPQPLPATPHPWRLPPLLAPDAITTSGLPRAPTPSFATLPHDPKPPVASPLFLYLPLTVDCQTHPQGYCLNSPLTPPFVHPPPPPIRQPSPYSHTACMPPPALSDVLHRLQLAQRDDRRIAEGSRAQPAGAAVKEWKVQEREGGRGRAPQGEGEEGTSARAGAGGKEARGEQQQCRNGGQYRWTWRHRRRRRALTPPEPPAGVGAGACRLQPRLRLAAFLLQRSVWW